MLQLELAILIAAQNDNLKRQLHDPFVHVGYHQRLKLMRALVNVTLDLHRLTSQHQKGPHPCR